MNARLRRSVEAMAIDYPDFAYRLNRLPAREVGIWEGSVRPVTTIGPVNYILDDLHQGRLVRVAGGEIVHHPGCRVEHERHAWMERLVYWRIRFELRVIYDGTGADPRCWVLTPPVNVLGRQRHVWSDGSICPFLSSTDWDADRDDVVDFMGHVVVWLVKWTLWNQTGIWIGSEHRADPEYHLDAVRPGDRCWCRSALPYARCHRPRDLQFVEYRRRTIAMVLAQSRVRQTRAA